MRSFELCLFLRTALLFAARPGSLADWVKSLR
jgi:hypothetical protein